MGMTADDIREQYSMQDVIERYGLHSNRAGFLTCPFHAGDHTASLKVYPKSFYCFGCHAHGDIFSFVMLMDDCSFKDAFKSLGGDSGPLSDAAITRMQKRKREAEKHKKKLEDALLWMRYCFSARRYIMTALTVMEPFGDAWCEAQDMLPRLERDADDALSEYLDVIGEYR